MTASYQPIPPFGAYSGSHRPKLLLVGEAWGAEEAQFRRPFIGQSGQELWRMLGEAMPLESPELHAAAESKFHYGPGVWSKERDGWLNAVGIGMTNVLNFRPPGNKIDQLCVPKKDCSKDYPFPAISHSKYLLPDFFPELSRLEKEIEEANPNLIVCLGNTACWAILQVTNIGQIRGTITQTANSFGSMSGVPLQKKVLPTYHPAGVLYQWSWRPIVVMDLMKGLREAQFSEIRRPARKVIINPSLEEIEKWVSETRQLSPKYLACDIETTKQQIKCVGFSRSSTESIIIPFFYPEALDKNNQMIMYPRGSYWPTIQQELRAWELVEELLQMASPLLFQNGMYDLQYLLRLGLKPTNCTEDTMLLHHSMFPEMLKGLGFLGSIYTSEPAWKLMRTAKQDTEKRDE